MPNQNVTLKTQAEILQLPISTQDGEFIAHYSEKGLARLDFPLQKSDSGPRQNNNVSAEMRSWHQITAKALTCALNGFAPQTLPPLDISGGTQFQQRVWSELQEIGCGLTRSYGEIARRVGKPEAVRAVGNACGANPIPVLVPCHRVLAAGRKLGGFSAGLNWKRKLLAREGCGAAKPEAESLELTKQ